METGPSAQTQPQSYQELPGAESPPAPRLGGGLRRSLREDPSGTQPAPNWGSPSRQGSPPLERCTLQGAPGEQAAPAPKQQSDKDNFCAPTCGQGFSRSCSHCPPPWMVASVHHLSVRGACKLSVHMSVFTVRKLRRQIRRSHLPLGQFTNPWPHCRCPATQAVLSSEAYITFPGYQLQTLELKAKARHGHVTTQWGSAHCLACFKYVSQWKNPK